MENRGWIATPPGAIRHSVYFSDHNKIWEVAPFF